MTRESVLILLSVLLALSPFLGLPYSWLMVLVPVLALCVLGIAIMLRTVRAKSGPTETYDTPEA